MKEEGAGVGELSRPALNAPGSLTTPVNLAKWRPKVLEEKKRAWNTRALGSRVTADATSAACAGVLVAPIITVIDRFA
jgi:hypothetical protein